MCHKKSPLDIEVLKDWYIGPDNPEALSWNNEDIITIMHFCDYKYKNGDLCGITEGYTCLTCDAKVSDQVDIAAKMYSFNVRS